MNYRALSGETRMTTLRKFQLDIRSRTQQCPCLPSSLRVDSFRKKLLTFQSVISTLPDSCPQSHDMRALLNSLRLPNIRCGIFHPKLFLTMMPKFSGGTAQRTGEFPFLARHHNVSIIKGQVKESRNFQLASGGLAEQS